VSSPCNRSAARTWALDQAIDRHQRMGAAADLITERRCAERHALAGEPLRLAVERLVLPVLLEQQHREEARPGPAAREHMKGRGRLRDLLAIPARKLLAHCLSDLPRTRDYLERLGDVFAELGKAAACRMPGRNRGRARRCARAAGDRGTACGSGACARTR
jgi:hypothetical protein